MLDSRNWETSANFSSAWGYGEISLWKQSTVVHVCRTEILFGHFLSRKKTVLRLTVRGSNRQQLFPPSTQEVCYPEPPPTGWLVVLMHGCATADTVAVVACAAKDFGNSLWTFREVDYMRGTQSEKTTTSNTSFLVIV